MRAWFRVLLDAWKRLARAVGVANTHVILFLAYWLVLGPVALLLRAFGRDYLRQRDRASSTYWLDRETYEHNLERASHPF